MREQWLISAGYLAEVARPALYVLSVIASALVLTDARRLLPTIPSLAWALCTLGLPHVVLPLYVAARLVSPRHTGNDSTQTEPMTDADAQTAPDATKRGRRRRLNTVPFIYAATLLAAGAIYFYLDQTSADGRLARAANARLSQQPERAIKEYRAVLAAGTDDPHTRKRLGIQLSEAGHFEEAITELRAAERGGEPDELLPLHIAHALERLGRHEEAHTERQRFLNGPACTRTPPHPHCEKRQK